MIRRVWDVTLTVSDLDRAVQFYSGVLGLPKKYQFKDYAGFDCGGVEIGLKTWGGMEAPRRGEPIVNFAVDDVDGYWRTLAGRGVEFDKEPHEAQWGARVAIFHDRDGNTLQISQVDWQKYLSVCAPR